MGNVKVKFLQTSAGVYGLAKEGDTAVLAEADAKKLEDRGVVEIKGSSSDEPTRAQAGHLTITDETGKSTAAETDPKNPTTEKTAASKGSAGKKGTSKPK